MMTKCVFAASVGVSIEPFCACILLYVLLYAMPAAPTTRVGLVLKGNVKRASKLRRWLTFMRTLKLIDPNLSLSQSNCTEATTKMITQVSANKTEMAVQNIIY